MVALEGISLEIGQGEIFGIIGLSGAGKSTLVRCMNLLERPNDGSVVVDGNEMTSLSERELRRARQSIGMIFQNFNLLMQRTALENVCSPWSLRGRRAGSALYARGSFCIRRLSDRNRPIRRSSPAASSSA